MKFIDLGRQYEKISKKIESRLNRILSSQEFIMGPEVRELEQKLGDFVGRRYCLTCGSGTEALQIPLMAYNLSEDDAVFVPSFTFFASAESISLAGGTPVFVDVDSTFNMDPDNLEYQIDRVKKQGSLNLRGIITVDLFGRSADYNRITEIAQKNGMFILEDAAQGFGGTYHGKRNGAFGDVSATSFFPAKPLGCYGDGGAIFTDDEQLYEEMRSIRIHGCGKNRYDNVRIGINGRLDTIQAAVLLEKLDIFEQELADRQKISEWYRSRLQNVLEIPVTDQDHFSSWAQYTLRAKKGSERDYIAAELKKREIPVMIYYPIPLHKQKVYVNKGYGDITLPYSEDISKRVFSIPMHPYLTEEEIDTICSEIKNLLK